jgi:FG-GAP-like repeat
VAIGDINNDGINDVVVGNINSNFISLYLMDGNSVQSTAQLPVYKGTDGLAVSDMDGYGKKDVIVTSSTDNNLVIFFNPAIR